MGLTVTSDDKGVKVFAKEKNGANGTFKTYSVGISSKQNDEWVNGYIDVLFKKGVDVANKSVIKINNAFYVCSKYNDKVYNKLMITDFDVITPGESPVTVNDDGFMNIPDDIADSLPFK